MALSKEFRCSQLFQGTFRQNLIFLQGLFRQIATFHGNNSLFVLLCLFSIFKRGLPLYHIKRITKGENTPCNDGTHIIYANVKMLTHGLLGNIMHDMSCKNANDMRIPYFAQHMRYLKEETEGQIIMCDALDRLTEKVATRERLNRNVEIAQRLLKTTDFSYEAIADATELSLEKVLELAKQQSA